MESKLETPDRKARVTSLLIGAAVAGLVFFVWSAISWMALPWQRGVFKTFGDESSVAAVLARAAPKSGVYGYPSEPKYPQGATKEQRDAIDQAAYEQIQRGPCVFAVVTHEGLGSYPRMLAIAFASNVLTALIVGWLLSQTSGLGYAERVAFVTLVAVVGAITCRIPDWNWHKFPLDYTLVNIASLVVGWALAGFALAHFVRGAH
jgi:hypothetical protein